MKHKINREKFKTMAKNFNPILCLSTGKFIKSRVIQSLKDKKFYIVEEVQNPFRTWN